MALRRTALLVTLLLAGAALVRIAFRSSTPAPVAAALQSSALESGPAAERDGTAPASTAPPELTSTRTAAPIDENEATPAELAAWTRHPFAVNVTDHFAEPMAGIAVRAQFESDSGGFAGARFEGVTDEEGRCTFELARSRAAAGPWLAVEAAPPPRYRKDRVRVRSTSESAELVLILTGGVEGTVRFDDGSIPPDGATLTVRWWLNSAVHGTAQTKVRGGAFAFESGLLGSVWADELRFAKVRAWPVAHWSQLKVEGGTMASENFLFQRPSAVR